jgi:outer membrane protein
MNRSNSLSIIALLAITPALSAWCAEKGNDGPEARSDYHWGLGAGVAVREQPYTDIDSQIIPLPVIFFKNRWVSFFGTNLELNLLNGPITLSARAEYSMNGYEPSDSPVLRGMAERRDGLWYGGAASWKNDVVDISASYLTDGANNSGGQRATVALQRNFNHGRFQFTPRLAAEWMSEDYVDYYYGVRTAEALPTRRAYVGDSAVNFATGLRTTWRFKPKQSLFLNLTVELLDDVIQESPIVDARIQPSVVFGYLYTFR